MRTFKKLINKKFFSETMGAEFVTINKDGEICAGGFIVGNFFELKPMQVMQIIEEAGLI